MFLDPCNNGNSEAYACVSGPMISIMRRQFHFELDQYVFYCSSALLTGSIYYNTHTVILYLFSLLLTRCLLRLIVYVQDRKYGKRNSYRLPRCEGRHVDETLVYGNEIKFYADSSGSGTISPITDILHVYSGSLKHVTDRFASFQKLKSSADLFS